LYIIFRLYNLLGLHGRISRTTGSNPKMHALLFYKPVGKYDQVQHKLTPSKSEILNLFRVTSLIWYCYSLF